MTKRETEIPFEGTLINQTVFCKTENCPFYSTGFPFNPTSPGVLINTIAIIPDSIEQYNLISCTAAKKGIVPILNRTRFSGGTCKAQKPDR